MNGMMASASVAENETTGTTFPASAQKLKPVLDIAYE
jgi:hypothetical protein